MLPSAIPCDRREVNERIRLTDHSETALRNPYEYASARKDYEGVLKALAAVEAGVQRRGAAPVDSRLAQLSQDQLLAVAKKGKEKIDSDLMKMAAASAAARQRLAE